MHLAQVNIGRIPGPIDSPVMAEFKANLAPIHTLPVWESIESLRACVYKPHHLDSQAFPEPRTEPTRA